MILFFDNYITDKNLGTIYKGLDKVRKSKTIYQKKTKKEICAYTLYSYSKIKFDFNDIYWGVHNFILNTDPPMI